MNDAEWAKKFPERMQPCYRCNRPGPHYDSGAVIKIKCGDDSYSGEFALPLCFQCACLPHERRYIRTAPRPM
jgi:hypothetical protein